MPTRAATASDDDAGGGLLLLLLASDLLAGVGLASALRYRRRRRGRGSPIIDDRAARGSRSGKEGEGERRSPPSGSCPSSSSSSSSSSIERREARGLRNVGQTCYANSVLQALASLGPVRAYLESLDDRRRGDGRRSVASALLRTLRHANGDDSGGTTTTTRGRATTGVFSFWPFSSYPSGGDPRGVMDAVASRHPQFRSRNGLWLASGALEQQDSHEFLSALMDVLSTEEEEEEEVEVEGAGEGAGGGRPDGWRRRSAAPVVVVAPVDRDGEGLSWCRRGDRLAIDGGGGGGTPGERWGGGCVPRARDGKSETGGVPFGSARGGRSYCATDEFEEEKKHEDRHHDDGEEGSDDAPHSPREAVVFSAPRAAGVVAPTTAAPAWRPRNPFDGWCGSTIRCASCRHVRPVRAAPFLALSLPIAEVRSEFVEDFLAAEYSGFSGAERVRDVRCVSCGVMRRAEELEEEATILDGAISSIGRRCGSGGVVEEGADKADVVALMRESHRIRRKIATLKALDPDADDDDDVLDCEDDDDGDLQRGNDPGVGGPTSRIVPVRGDAFRASLLMRPPEVLCIHIQRRHYDPSSRRMSKVTRHVRFGERLDLGPYCAYGEASFEEDGRIPAATPQSYNRARTIPYRLMSVIEHLGDAFGGHYQTYRRLNPKRNEWVLISDESVASRTFNEVRRCQAYMLFYVAASPKNEPS